MLNAECSSRAVFLGASNLALGLPAVLAAARAVLGGPVDVLGAFGFGRSYGRPSRVLGRGLPGIAGCGLWDALRRHPPAPAWALLTDVGNDIVYGAAPAEITGWVDACLERLGDEGARTVLTLLPLGSIEALPRWRFEAARRIIFPGRPISRADVLGRARDLDARLRDVAVRRGADLAPMRPEWFGLDGIHLRRGLRAGAWLEVLDRWRPGETTGRAVRPSFRSWPGLLGLRPEIWSLFGIERRRAQPCRVLRDGTTISLF
jgi:hypothetical protein